MIAQTRTSSQLLTCLRDLRCVLAVRPNPSPIAEEQVGEWHHRYRQECDQARAPLVSQPLIHLQPEQREGRFRVVSSQPHGLLDSRFPLFARDHLPANTQRVNAFAAIADAAYFGYASTRNVNMPVKTSNVLDGDLVSHTLFTTFSLI